MGRLKLELENSTMPLDQRLEDLGISREEYKTYDMPKIQERKKKKKVLTIH